jgi:hypothetical protein
VAQNVELFRELAHPVEHQHVVRDRVADIAVEACISISTNFTSRCFAGWRPAGRGQNAQPLGKYKLLPLVGVP